MRCLVVASCLLCLLQSAHAAFNNGALIPPGTAAGQDLLWSTTANNMMGGWVPSSSILSNGTQVAIGGSVDSNSRLAVNPSGTSENGITVNMPSGATGYGLGVKNSTGTKLFWVDAGGNAYIDYNSLGSSQLYFGNGRGIIFGTSGSYIKEQYGINISGPSSDDTHPVSIPNQSLHVGSGGNGSHFGSGNLWVSSEILCGAPNGLSSSGSGSVFTGTAGAVIASSYSQAVRSVSTTDTATLSDSYLRLTAAVAETLPTTSVPTGRTFTVLSTVSGASLTNTVNGTSGYTFSAPYKYITVIYNGSSYDLIGGN